MVSWIWIPIVFMLGAFTGIMLLALIEIGKK